jgi:hypothetical protein
VIEKPGTGTGFSISSQIISKLLHEKLVPVPGFSK